jgi:hypothetical protein
MRRVAHALCMPHRPGNCEIPEHTVTPVHGRDGISHYARIYADASLEGHVSLQRASAAATIPVDQYLHCTSKTVALQSTH